MGVLEKLRHATTADDSRDLSEFFGVSPDALRFDRGTITVGDETITLEEARDAIRGSVSQPVRRIHIGDL